MNEPKDKQMISQHEIESSTGFSREVLRKWELRFQFPLPQRDSRGRRVYTPLDLQQLHKIRLLLGCGFRPRQLLGLSLCELNAMCDASGDLCQVTKKASCDLEGELFSLFTSQNFSDEIFVFLNRQINETGISMFLHETLPRLNALVGDAWARKLLSIQAEHVYTEIVHHLLNDYLSQIDMPANAPIALLTTPPGEMHGLGLSSLKIIMALNGTKCISLGLGTPALTVGQAAVDWSASYVCISVSSSMPHKLTQSYLNSLRKLLPDSYEIWAGGSGVMGLTTELVPKVVLLSGLKDAEQRLMAQNTHAYAST